MNCMSRYGIESIRKCGSILEGQNRGQSIGDTFMGQRDKAKVLPYDTGGGN